MIKIICVGKLKEQYWIEACDEYKKRLTKYTNIEVIEVIDEKIDESQIALEKEKDRIEKNINPKDYLITLEIDGEELTSEKLAEKIDKILIQNSNITFIIGGSHGIHPDIKRKANYHLSFSKLTFPHQLFRVLLLEQIFRSYKILNNEKYHK
ncbi:MAG: 23S rRNA (pseudouridine(1915)-N(3))-methyltransferase RlmH [Firmicutes bacterium]|nr:23S rRNA (pseudouridine(1915)-N(3))-methyltransferase RlmH [Bacillota bacterium]